MVTPDKVTSYWFVFLRGGELNIAPFGLNKLSEPTIVFKDFTKENLVGALFMMNYISSYMENIHYIKNKYFVEKLL